MLDYQSDNVLSAAESDGFAAVIIPMEMQIDLGCLLQSLEHYSQKHNLPYSTRMKPEGGHITDWWIRISLDSHQNRTHTSTWGAQP